MRLDSRQNNCITCPPIPSCNCSPNQTCLQISQSCTACGTVKCQDRPSSSQGGGVSKGALAGAVIGILLFIAAALAAVWYFQKRVKARRAMEARPPEPKPDIPASAETVLSRPDPVEKPSSPAPGHVRVFSGQSDTTINLHPSSSRSGGSHDAGRSGESQIHNPFADELSIQTVSEQSNDRMVPIALVPYGSVSSPPAQGSENPYSRGNMTSPVPSRPLRSPDLNLRIGNGQPSGPPSSFDLTHVNISNDSVINIPRRGAAPSTRSDLSGRSAGSRASYMSTGTYATDLFTESPTIVTRQQGRILGLSKAQVVEVPASFSGSGSPLASSHLTPSASRLSRMTTSRSIRSPLTQPSFTAGDIIEMDEQPEASPFTDANARPSSSTRDSHQGIIGDDRSTRTNGTFGSHVEHWVADDTDSIASGVEASITSAKRVIVGANSRGVSQSSVGSVSQSSGRPVRYSYLSEASSRADSILEAFPFVPPSPLSTQSFKSGQSPAPSSPVAANPPATTNTTLDPPNRRVLGLSTFSQGSTASSGLEAFPFQLQIDSSADSQGGLAQRGARASLDTLALSRDLSAFPLAYDDEPEPTGRSKYAAPSRKSSNTHVHS